MSTCEVCGATRDSSVTTESLPSSDENWIFVCRTGNTEDHWIHRPEACRDVLRARVQEIADALYTTPKKVVETAKAWADELHKLRGRLVSWASSCRLLAREMDADHKLDLETPFDAKLANAISGRARKSLAAAHLCGWDNDNPDTCGVCHKHFAECEQERVIVGDVNDADEPACPGARVRRAMQESS